MRHILQNRCSPSGLYLVKDFPKRCLPGETSKRGLVPSERLSAVWKLGREARAPSHLRGGGGVPTFLVLGHPHALGNSSLPLGSSWAPVGVIQNLQGNQIETTNPQRRGRWGQKDFAVKSKIQMEGRSSHHRDLIKQTTEFSL